PTGESLSCAGGVAPERSWSLRPWTSTRSRWRVLGIDAARNAHVPAAAGRRGDRAHRAGRAGLAQPVVGMARLHHNMRSKTMADSGSRTSTARDHRLDEGQSDGSVP